MIYLGVVFDLPDPLLIGISGPNQSIEGYGLDSSELPDRIKGTEWLERLVKYLTKVKRIHTSKKFEFGPDIFVE